MHTHYSLESFQIPPLSGIIIILVLNFFSKFNSEVHLGKVVHSEEIWIINQKVHYWWALEHLTNFCALSDSLFQNILFNIPRPRLLTFWQSLYNIIEVVRQIPWPGESPSGPFINEDFNVDLSWSSKIYLIGLKQVKICANSPEFLYRPECIPLHTDLIRPHSFPKNFFTFQPEASSADHPHQHSFHSLNHFNKKWSFQQSFQPLPP